MTSERSEADAAADNKRRGVAQTEQSDGYIYISQKKIIISAAVVIYILWLLGGFFIVSVGSI